MFLCTVLFHVSVHMNSYPRHKPFAKKLAINNVHILSSFMQRPNGNKILHPHVRLTTNLACTREIMDVDTTVRINNRWAISETLGYGAFSTVYLAEDMSSPGTTAAVKVELPSREFSLMREKKVYESFNCESRSTTYIANIYYFGSYCGHDAMVIDSYGINLGEFQKSYGGRLAVPAIMWIGFQMVQALEYVHGKGIIHRHIEPGNIVLGRSNRCTLHLIDFGFARSIHKEDSSEHIDFAKIGMLVGSREFASANAHCGMELSRRDDIISLLYTLVFLFKGKLAWSEKSRALETEENEDIKNQKLRTSPEALFEEMPWALVDVMTYVSNLPFEKAPDFEYLKNTFGRVMRVWTNETENGSYDWVSAAQTTKTLQ